MKLKEGFELGTIEQRGALLGMLVDEAEGTIEGLSLEYELVAQKLPAKVTSVMRRRVVDQTTAQSSQIVDDEFGMYIDGAIETLPFDTHEFALSLAIRQGRDYWIKKVKDP